MGGRISGKAGNRAGQTTSTKVQLYGRFVGESRPCGVVYVSGNGGDRRVWQLQASTADSLQAVVVIGTEGDQVVSGDVARSPVVK
jgi:hypothetical protein